MCGSTSLQPACRPLSSQADAGEVLQEAPQPSARVDPCHRIMPSCHARRRHCLSHGYLAPVRAHLSVAWELLGSVGDPARAARYT